MVSLPSGSCPSTFPAHYISQPQYDQLLPSGDESVYERKIEITIRHHQSHRRTHLSTKFISPTTPHNHTARMAPRSGHQDLSYRHHWWPPDLLINLPPTPVYATIHSPATPRRVANLPRISGRDFRSVSSPQPEDTPQPIRIRCRYRGRDIHRVEVLVLNGWIRLIGYECCVSYGTLPH